MNDLSRGGRARLTALASSTTAAVGALVFALAACESATNLDIHYGDASAALEASFADGEAGVVPSGGPILTGCPCEESAGLGCCLPAARKPFCTEDTSVCATEHGTHLKCVRPDPTTESVCCWHPDTKAGAVTALAAGCDGGVAACQTNGDCAGTGKSCSLAKCFGGTITIGACDTTPPTCPQP